MILLEDVLENSILCEKKQRYIKVGTPELGRNHVFYDIFSNNYLKYYKVKERFENEYKALSVLSNNPYVPKVIEKGDMCLTLSALNGESIDENHLNELNYEKMGDFLKKFHNVYEGNVFSAYYKGRYYSNIIEFEYARYQYANEILGGKIEFKKALKNMEMILKEFSKSSNMFRKFVLCHQDYCGRNILFLNNEITGVIDFENSYYSDPLSDIAKILIKEKNNGYIDRFIKAYFKNPLSQIEIQKLLLFSMQLAMEICTWSEKKDPDYYMKALNFLKEVTA